MHSEKFLTLLIIVICITGQCVVYTDNTPNDRQAFSQRIQNLQTETSHLCSYIRTESLVSTKEFIRLMQDAHIDCPNLQEMQVPLANIAKQADTYHSYVTQQSSECDAILYMLTKSLDNGALVDYYLKEGNYSLVTSTLNKWHQTFLNFKSQFHLKDIPLDIILNNKHVFFYDNWLRSIAKSVSILIGLFITSLLLMKFLTGIGLILWIIDLFISSTTSSRQKQLPIRDKLSETDITQNYLDSTKLQRRRPVQIQHVSSPEVNKNPLIQNDANIDRTNVVNSTMTPGSNKIATIVRGTVWFLTFSGLIVITILYYPSSISLSQSSRYNWYPAATTTVDKMRIDREKVQFITIRQIPSIEELQRYANMYHDQTIQQNADILISNLATGIQRASKEVSELYIAGEKLPSVFRNAYTSIEAKAKKAGRLNEATNLLVALQQTGEKYEHLQRSIQVLMVNQQELLPMLKEQTEVMHALIQQGHIWDIHRIAKEHIKTTMIIDGYTYDVQIEVKDLIQIVENDNSNGMKTAISGLKDQTVLDQYKAMIMGAVGSVGGSVGGAVLGTIAIKSGYAIVSVTATAVAGPVAAAAGAVGLLGLGAYAALMGFNDYKDAARYKMDLDVVEAHRGNLHIAMKNLEKALNEQETASKATQTALNNIVTHSASFSNIPGFVLPTEKRIALSNELLRLIQQYNTMSSIFDSFKPHMVDKNRKRLAA